MSNSHTDPSQAKQRPAEMRQDYYHGNWYEVQDPDPPTFHQSKGIHWGLLGVLAFIILFWITIGFGAYIIFF